MNNIFLTITVVIQRALFWVASHQIFPEKFKIFNIFNFGSLFQSSTTDGKKINGTFPVSREFYSNYVQNVDYIDLPHLLLVEANLENIGEPHHRLFCA